MSTVTLRGVTGALGVPGQLLTQAFADGYPFSIAALVPRPKPELTFIPEGGVLELWHQDNDGELNYLVKGEGWKLHVRNVGHTVELNVAASRKDLAQSVIAALTADASLPPESQPEPDESEVSMNFWFSAEGQRPRMFERQIAAPRWDEVRGNYPTNVIDELERLMKLTPDDINGKLLLLHGPPGTGKTSLLRALAQEWGSWCQVETVMDPENLFGIPSYLVTVALGEQYSSRDWTLLVLEDSDELMRAGANGQALAKLLNLTDGLLGQGRKVLVAITTNEDLAALHPAVTRPGRSLASIHIGQFPRSQAQTWLDEREPGKHTAPAEGLSLAEMYALLGQD